MQLSCRSYLIYAMGVVLISLQSMAQLDTPRQHSQAQPRYVSPQEADNKTKAESRYTVPRKVRENEKPRNTRAKLIASAKLRVQKNYEEVLRRADGLQSEVDKNNTQVDAEFHAQLQAAAEKAKQKGEPFTSGSRRALEFARNSRYRSAYNEAYYGLVQQYLVESGSVCEPDIDTVAESQIQPGAVAELNGTCFGPSQGKVLLEVAPQNVIELEVILWDDTKVWGRVNPIIAEVPLRPHYGRIWLQTGGGVTSNVWPMMYYPRYGWYIATWTKHAFGGLWGYSDDAIFLKDRMLGDADFTVERVERSDWGDGWSKLQYPNAAGQSMAQGWHIGVDAGKHAYMGLLYRVYGPKGIDPPYFDELGPWGYLGDDW